LQKPKTFDSAAVLRRVPLFMGLSEDQVYLLVQICSVRRAEKDQVIFLHGSDGTEAFVILSGSVRIESVASSGQMTTLAVRKPGDVLGEMAILDHQPRSATGVANEATRLLVIRADDFGGLVRRNPEIGIKLIRYLCSRLRELSKNLTEQRLESLETRVLRYIQSRTNAQNIVQFAVPQRKIAQELGCTREALNRNLKRLEAESVIQQIGRNTYKLIVG
jgi:CRP/FNR family transcriptional regulator, cyclic AMP receptor protein